MYSKYSNYVMKERLKNKVRTFRKKKGCRGTDLGREGGLGKRTDILILDLWAKIQVPVETLTK